MVIIPASALPRRASRRTHSALQCVPAARCRNVGAGRRAPRPRRRRKPPRPCRSIRSRPCSTSMNARRATRCGPGRTAARASPGCSAPCSAGRSQRSRWETCNWLPHTRRGRLRRAHAAPCVHVGDASRTELSPARFPDAAGAGRGEAARPSPVSRRVCGSGAGAADACRRVHGGTAICRARAGHRHPAALASSRPGSRPLGAPGAAWQAGDARRAATPGARLAAADAARRSEGPGVPAHDAARRDHAVSAADAGTAGRSRGRALGEYRPRSRPLDDPAHQERPASHRAFVRPGGGAVARTRAARRRCVGFPAIGSGARAGNWDRESKAITQAAGIREPFHRHDLRRSASTALGDLGELPHVIKAALNHVVTADPIDARYNRSRNLPERTAAVQRLADMLDALQDGARVVRHP